MTGDTDINVITDADELEALGEAWNALLATSVESSSPFLTHEWVCTWWRHFGAGQKLKVLIVTRHGETIGIAPLMETAYGIGPARIKVLETIGGTDCNHVALMDPRHSGEVVKAVLAYAEREASGSGIIVRLTSLPEDCAFLKLWAGSDVQMRNGVTVHRKAVDKAPYVMLPNTWDSYFDSLGRRRRRQLRVAARSLAEEGLHSDFQLCPVEDLDVRLERFFELHRDRWSSVSITSKFQDPRTRAFYRDIAHRFMMREWLHFSCLCLNGEMVSGDYGFVDNSRFYNFTAARDARYRRHDIGHLHTMHLVKAAIERGLAEFDFMRGDEAYKYYWAKSARDCVEIVVIRRAISGGARLRALRLLLRLREMKSYSPGEVCSRLRMRRRERREKRSMGLAG